METAKSYEKKITEYFSEIADKFDAIFKKYISYNYGEKIKYVDMVVYPEGFTENFAVSVWPTLADRSVDTEIFKSHFDRQLEECLEENLDPYDNDYEWRDEIFFKVLCEFFSDSWKRNKGYDYPMRFYLMTPDADKSWAINKSCLVSEHNK